MCFSRHIFLLGSLSLQCGELLYEKRQYEKGNWACITMREDTYEQSICYGFMRIMRYICQQNSLGESTRDCLHIQSRSSLLTLYLVLHLICWSQIQMSLTGTTFSSCRWLPRHDATYRDSGAHRWESFCDLPRCHSGVLPSCWASGPTTTSWRQRDFHWGLACYYSIHKVSRE